jgi:hypothetical protein
MDKGTSTTQRTAPGNPPTDPRPGPDPRHAEAPPEGQTLKLGAVFVQTIRHYFPDLNDWLQHLPDTRVQDECTYETRFLAWWGILLFTLQLGSRRQLNFELDDQGTQVLANINRLAGTNQDTRPVDGTLDHFIGHVGAAGIASLRTRMVRHLIRGKVLDDARFLGRFVVAVDATGLYTFSERHCEHCLVTRHATCTTYSHNVLEAKLLGPGDMVLSLASEFIDNEDAGTRLSADDFKQDCELSAFSRLAPLLHRDFPQLRLCLTADALYACGRFFALCAQYKWAYVVTFKEGQMPAVWAEYQMLLSMVPEQRVERVLPAGVRQVYRWVNDLSYTDSEDRTWAFSALQCEEISPDGPRQFFAWLTNLEVDAQSVEPIANQGGRPRWRIENQAFNRQKNSDLNLHHLYSKDPDNLKAYYLLMQVAHLLMQLVEQGSLLRHLAEALGKTPVRLLGSMKNLASRLLESLRNFLWPDEYFDPAAAAQIHISIACFNSS